VEQSLEFKKYAVLFFRWWWLIAVLAGLGAGAAYVASSRAAPLYTATATLRVQAGSAGNEAQYVNYAEPLAETHSQMLVGWPILEAATTRLGGALTPEALAKLIEVEQVPDTGLIRLSVTYGDPVQAAQIANALAEAYVAHNDALQQSRYADRLAGMQVRMNEMAVLIEDTTAAIAAIGVPVTDQEHAELARLETALASYRNTYAVLGNSYEQMRLTATLSTDNVSLFERAKAPRMPDSSRKMQKTLLAAMVGAVLAAGIVYVMGYLDTTLRTPGDVQSALGLDTLGVIGRMGSEGERRVIADRLHSAVSEAYRRLRTNVLSAAADGSLRTLLVTSASHGEGKSLVAANLATAMAQAGLKVVLVDADLRRPVQHALFGLAPGDGLAQSLLAGQINGHVRPIEGTEGLEVLPGGELPSNPSELLASPRMRAFLEKLRDQADLVIVDSSPLLPVTDAAVLASKVDGVLLVIDAGRTPRGEVRQAVESLRRVDARLLGAVLNGVPQRGKRRSSYPIERQAGDLVQTRTLRTEARGANSLGTYVQSLLYQGDSENGRQEGKG
jgi:non-specific protein-tyrosine kinase